MNPPTGLEIAKIVWALSNGKKVYASKAQMVRELVPVIDVSAKRTMQLLYLLVWMGVIRETDRLEARLVIDIEKWKECKWK